MMIFRSSLLRSFVLAAGASGLLLSCTPPPPRHPEDICAIFTERRAWYRAAVKAEKKWQVPLAVTMAIIYQESGFRGQVGTKRTKILGVIPGGHISTAYGYAQAENGIWGEYLQSQTQRRRRHSFKDSFDFVDWYIARSAKKLSLPKDDAYNQYLAYHEGITGYRRGTFENKPEIKKIAERTQALATTYQQQYTSCKPQLEKRSFLRWFFEAVLAHLAG